MAEYDWTISDVFENDRTVFLWRLFYLAKSFTRWKTPVKPSKAQ